MYICMYIRIYINIYVQNFLYAMNPISSFQWLTPYSRPFVFLDLGKRKRSLFET